MIRPAFFYGGPAASLVHGFKYRSRLDAARFSGRQMARALDRFPEIRDFDCLAPVPLHPSRMRERGYNQALLLAQEVSAAVGKPIEEPLARRFPTKPQWNLGRRQRSKNLVNGIVARDGSPKDKRILLVDDVCTTSATLEECAKALRLAGASSVNALVFARQTYRG
ncbi:MAG: ComF family protein [Elusimicrobia bacterium]|nr:ComF family protein [Elusimicrobiota bacterium]